MISDFFSFKKGLCGRCAHALILFLAGSSSALAGGPLALCQSGVPFTWPGGGLNIPFNPDQGGLGPLNNAQGVAQVQSAFGAWEAVPTSAATYVNAGPLPVDVNISNFFDYLFPLSPDGLSAIVFDETGEIFDLLFGPGSGILGFAGPEWINFSNCSILEGVAFLNGPAFTDATVALDVMVHEFGHYSGLAHTVVNGQILIGDSSGPSPNNTFGFPNPADLETMYPFYFGPGIGFSTPHKDDIATISSFYPTAGFAAGSGTISGTIRRSNHEPITGVNVIARNIAAPFQDAVSAISGDYSEFFNPSDSRAGTYTLRGLTPGAQYAIYVDQIFAGGFSTPIAFPIPGPEEFYNGANESDNIATTDPVLDSTPVSAAAGGTVAGVDIIFNYPKPGEPLPVGDDSFFELSLPFTFEICGQRFSTVWVNANGNLTFGSPDFSPFFNIGALLQGPPRIAGLWRDLNPAAGGKVSYSIKGKVFSVIWSKVPEFPNTGANTFQIDLQANNQADIIYGAMSAIDGIAGLSGGGLVTSRFETPDDLSASANGRTITLQKQPAFFEEFTAAHPNDLANKTLRLTATTDFNDRWSEPNNSLAQVRRVSLPFDSKASSRYTELQPGGADIDFFSFTLTAGDLFVGRIASAAFDSLIGLYKVSGSGAKTTGQLVAVDDDSGPGTLSTIGYKVLQSGTYALAVTATPDFKFTGAGQGRGRYVVDLQILKPDPNNPIINGSFELDFIGWTFAENGIPFIPWLINGAGAGAGFGMAPTQPQDGLVDAWNGFDGFGPMTFTLFQDVSIRANAASAKLEWKDRFQWNYFVGTQTLPRTYAVEIRDPATDAVLATLFTFDTGINPGLGDSGWLSHSVDISAFIGSTIRVHFLESIPEPFTGPGQFEIDGVRLPVQ